MAIVLIGKQRQLEMSRLLNKVYEVFSKRFDLGGCKPQQQQRIQAFNGLECSLGF
jgi:hypothetical protein